MPRNKLKQRYMQGVLHNLRISLLTHKQMQKQFANKNEVVSGAYVEHENTVYLDRQLPKEALLHTALHEWVHAMETHTKNMDEETKCDTVATALIKLIGLTDIEEVLLPEED